MSGELDAQGQPVEPLNTDRCSARPKNHLSAAHFICVLQIPGHAREAPHHHQVRR